MYNTVLNCTVCVLDFRTNWPIRIKFCNIVMVGKKMAIFLYIYIFSESLSAQLQLKN